MRAPTSPLLLPFVLIGCCTLSSASVPTWMAASNTSISLTLEPFAASSDAVCNDGSPGGIYFAPASSTLQANVWLLWFEGGGWCYSNDSCASRCAGGHNSLCTSTVWSRTSTQDGIFSPQPSLNPLATANKAFLRYCTSDGHMGDIGPSPSSTDTLNNMQFRGQKMVEQAAAALVAKGLGASSRHTLVLGGASAGGRGAMVWCDNIGRLLPATVQVVCALDSPYWMDLPPFQPGHTTLAQTTQGVVAADNVTAVGDSACSAAHPGTDRWSCFFGQYRMPFLRRPFLLFASQADAFQLGWDLGHGPPYNDAERAFAEHFAASTRSSLTALAPHFASNTSGAYSSQCNNHAVAQTHLFYTERVQQATMAQALAHFLQANDVPIAAGFAPGPPAPSPTSPLLWVEPCTSFNCGQACH